ncbi:MAG: flagellar basal body P-ring formation protein FlgA [Verrucomicrobia bacterium]|nr:flagellar basal body P-ring formation protein FlgA [Verrucomicrobiota bacterium]
MRALRPVFAFLFAAALGALAADGGAGLPTRAPAIAPAGQDARGTTAPLTREQFLAALTRDLAAHFNLDGDLQLELLRPWSPPARVAAAWSVQVAEYPSLAASSMLVRCRVLADQTVAAESTLVLRAMHWRDAWVTRFPLSAGAVFDPTQLETRRVDLLRERDAVPAAVGDRTYLFARALTAGRLLTWHDIARRPLVKKGEVVEVSAAEGRLLVTMKALAMENGAQGDTVTVRNPESQKNFAATVIDENRVQVRF